MSSVTTPGPELTRAETDLAAELVSVDAELRELHGLLDLLCAGNGEKPAADRLRSLIASALGAHASHVLNLNAGKLLARFHLQNSGHPQDHTCGPCREARMFVKGAR